MPSAPVMLLARATHPIGQALAPGLAREGFDVVVGFDQDAETAQGIVEVVQEEDQRALALPGRLGDPMAAKSVVKQTVREFGRLDRLAVMPRSQTLETPPSDSPTQAFANVDLGQVETVLQADLKGPWVLLQAAAQQGFETEQACAVIVGTAGPHRAGIEGVASRAADEALAEVVATAGEALESRVKVNAVRPGLLVPEEAQSPETDIEEEDQGDDARGRGTTPSEVASVVAHLLQAPAGLTGQIVQVGQPPVVGRAWEDESDEVAQALPGIEQRIEPPDPEERIDLDDSNGGL